jgi:5-formyltetrahydrofolate cyclo-ligase
MSVEEIRVRKRVLRTELVARILALDPEKRRRDEAVLASRFPALPGFAAAQSVLLYAKAFPEEIATEPLLSQALRLGKTVLCSRVDRRERRLRLFRVDEPIRQLAPGVRGIPEPNPDCLEVAPDAVDWVLVPGLGFDTRGYRLGRGAGHYDQLFTQLRPATPRWALIHDCQWVDDLPLEPHDVAIDGVASPTTIIEPTP